MVLLGAGAFWFLRRNGEENGEEELPTVIVRRGDLRVTVAATGVLEPLTTVEVKSQTGGEIDEMYVEAGDLVKAGDLIAQLDPTALQEKVDQAQATVDAADARVVQAHYSAEAQRVQTRTGVAEAEASLQTARARLRQAQSQLTEARESTAQSVAQAQARLDAARARLAEAKVQEEVQPQLTQADIRQAEASLERARQDLAMLEAGNRPEEIAQARARVDEVRAILENAETELRREERLLAKGFTSQQSVDAARRAYRAAQAQLESASQSYELAKAGPRAEEIAKARAAVRQAQAGLEAARSQRVQVELRIRERESAEAAVTEAVAALAAARTTRETQIAVRQDDVDASRRLVEQAQASLERARAGRLTDETRSLDIRAAAADRRKAQASLDDVQYNFENTTVIAPRDGVVLEKHAEEGTVVPAGTAALAQGTAIVTIADITEMYVMADVDEVDISKVSVDQTVEISVETLPNVDITGVVDKIYPQGQEQENVIYFPVRIRVLDLHPDLRPGMTADVTILTAERTGVLLVPDSAIDRSGGKTMVQVLPRPGAEPVDREVEVGVSDWESTEIISGLKEGEVVVLPAAAPEAQMQDEGRSSDAARTARRATRMLGHNRRR